MAAFVSFVSEGTSEGSPRRALFLALEARIEDAAFGDLFMAAVVAPIAPLRARLAAMGELAAEMRAALLSPPIAVVRGP